MDNIYAKHIFEQIMKVQACSVEIVKQGLSTAVKYHIRTEEKEYLLKITTEKLDLPLYDVLLKMYKAGIRVVAALNWKELKEAGMIALVYDWLPGENLNNILSKCSDKDKIRYGIAAAKLIRDIHQFEIDSEVTGPLPYYLYKRYNFFLFLHRVTYPYKKDMDKYIKKQKTFFKRYSRRAFTHQDFRPENILVYKGNLYLIDFEAAYISDLYSDFVFCISMQPEYQIPYSRSLIMEYFDGMVPEEFWKWTCFYCILAVQKYAIWKYRNKHKMVKLQAEHLYDLYEKLTTDIPVFWEN